MVDKILIIGGPTASGKSGLAVQIAQANSSKQPSVIINADSMQVYQEIPLISAQPSTEDQADIPHLLYGFHSAQTPFSVNVWLKHAITAIKAAHQQNILPILVGGTGMYLKSLIHGIAPVPDIPDNIRLKARALLSDIGNNAFHQHLSDIDPTMAEKLNASDTQRVLRAWEVITHTGTSLAQWQNEPHITHFSTEQFFGYFLNPPRPLLYEQCDIRFLSMIDNGIIDEVSKLDIHNIPADSPALKALGIPEILSYLRKDISLEEAITKAQQSTRRYAKRQITWFNHQLPLLQEISAQEEYID